MSSEIEVKESGKRALQLTESFCVLLHSLSRKIPSSSASLRPSGIGCKAPNHSTFLHRSFTGAQFTLMRIRHFPAIHY
jgi:hypothetical protein